MPPREGAPSCLLGSSCRAQGRPLPLLFHPKPLLGIGEVRNQGIVESLGGKEHRSQPGTLNTTQDQWILVGTRLGLGGLCISPHVTVQERPPHPMPGLALGAGGSREQHRDNVLPLCGVAGHSVSPGFRPPAVPSLLRESPGSPPGWHPSQPDTTRCHVTPLGPLAIHTVAGFVEADAPPRLFSHISI